MIRHLHTAALGALTIASLVAAQPSPTASDEPMVFTSPVSPPVIADPFRAPTRRFGPGNRAVELATRPGEPVKAPGPGVVAFANQVAGRLVISIDHPNGLRSSLSGLATLSLTAGQSVQTGQTIGLADDALDVSLRAGGTYIEPTALWPDSGLASPTSPTGPPIGARLVPVPE